VGGDLATRRDHRGESSAAGWPASVTSSGGHKPRRRPAVAGHSREAHHGRPSRLLRGCRPTTSTVQLHGYDPRTRSERDAAAPWMTSCTRARSATSAAELPDLPSSSGPSAGPRRRALARWTRSSRATTCCSAQISARCCRTREGGRRRHPLTTDRPRPAVGQARARARRARGRHPLTLGTGRAKLPGPLTGHRPRLSKRGRPGRSGRRGRVSLGDSGRGLGAGPPGRAARRSSGRAVRQLDASLAATGYAIDDDLKQRRTRYRGYRMGGTHRVREAQPL